MPYAKKKVTFSLTSDLADQIATEKGQSAFIESLARSHYSSMGLEIGYTKVEDGRGGARAGAGRRSTVSFRCPEPTRGDVTAMLIFQSHYRPEHQLARGDQGQVARKRIKNSLTKYGQWLKVATIKNQIVGTIGVYPVLQSAIDGVLNGTMDDSALIPSPEGTACYISGINILPTHRRSRRIIHGLIAQLCEAIAQMAPVMVYAQPATPEGKRMALRMGFEQCKGQDDAEDPLYQCFAESAIDVWQTAMLKGI